MKWTETQIIELKAACMAEFSNQEIAAYFSVPVREIYAKRSQLGITIPKIKAMKERQTATESLGSVSTWQGLETFNNAGEICIVLARTGHTALIGMPKKRISNFVVPLEHKPGTSDWWQGRYFNELKDAWRCYEDAVCGCVTEDVGQ